MLALDGSDDPVLVRFADGGEFQVQLDGSDDTVLVRLADGEEFQVQDAVTCQTRVSLTRTEAQAGRKGQVGTILALDMSDDTALVRFADGEALWFQLQDLQPVSNFHIPNRHRIHIALQLKCGSSCTHDMYLPSATVQI